MAEPMVMSPERLTLSRKVWVVNHYSKPYSEDFRGRTITIPGNSVKEVLMPVLEANRFLGQPKRPAEKLPNGQYAPGQQPKALEIIELTAEEIKRIEGKSATDIEKENLEIKASSKNSCSACEAKFPTEKGLSLHVRRIHPELEAEKAD